MPIQVSQVFEYLDKHPVSQYSGDLQSLLELLYSAYIEVNKIETDSIRKNFRYLDELLGKLTISENDQIFNIVSLLCLEYEQVAFAHGISVGMRLMTEINQLS